MALLLSMIMVLAMSVTAFAAATTSGKLKVSLQNGSLKEQRIYLFKLFDYTETEPATYTANVNYKEKLKTTLSVETNADYDLYSAIAALGADNSEAVQNFANNFTNAIISKGNIEGTLETDYWVADVITDTKFHEFQNVDPGYYLVYLGGSQAIQSSLVTVNGDTEVNLKSTTPTPDKQAFDSTGTKPVGSVQVGDVLTYKVTAKVPDISAYNPTGYVFTLKDTLSAGLDFVTNSQGTPLVGTSLEVKVTVDGSAVQPVLNATISGRDMTLELAEVVKKNQTKIGKDIVVTYYAQVNEDAVIDNTNNSAKLEYSNDPETNETGESLPDVVKTPTFSINVHKFEKGKENEYLAGAEFQLHKAQENGEIDNNAIIKMKEASDNGSYVVAKDQSSLTAVDTVVTVASQVNGGNYNLQINGLAAGTYYLVETNAPEGFNLLNKAIKLVVTDTTNDGTPSYDITVNDDPQPATGDIVGVANSRGTILPGTGGMGTVIFTVAGIVLILGVGASFVISRKKKSA